MMQKIGQSAISVFKNTFISLRHRNFRFFWTGQCISLIGTFMQRAAQYWLVYSITRSPLLVGILGACQFLPMMLFSLFAGVIVDRFPKKKIIMLTQASFFLQALMLTVLSFFGNIQYWHILVLSVAYGVTLTFDMPARQTFVFELVGKEDIMNAVSLNSTAVNVAKVAGPAVAGILMLHLGISACFFVNALSYIAVLGSLMAVKTFRKAEARKSGGIMKEMAAGLAYIRKSETLKINILVFGIVSTFAMNNDVIVPVFARDVFGAGTAAYTSLLAAAGAGSLLGALVMAMIGGYDIRKRLLVLGALGTALLHVSVLFTGNYLVCILLLSVMGFVNMVFFNAANSIFQIYSSDEYRGRVMSVYSLLNQGSTPVGNFYAGTVMQHFGGVSGYFSCGAATILFLFPVLIAKRRHIAEWFGKRKKNAAPEDGQRPAL